MEKNTLFYSVAIYLPTIFMLYSLGNIVFVMGEFKENFSKVPRLLIMMFTKLVLLSSMLLFSLHYNFDNCMQISIEIPLFVLGIYMIFELFITNKIIHNFSKYSVCRFSSKDKFIRYTKFSTQNILKYNKLLFGYTTILLFSVIITFIVAIFINYSTLILSILVLSLLLLLVKVCILKYLKTL